jgi:nitroimidazol reductase NimA-like FMN-containing flavoprotein (pyridoxamine 5'-phosphate oxidase superfamily)
MTTKSSESVERPAVGELTYGECHQRLASTSTGRVGWSVGTVQYILPVSYAMHVGKVVFRTSPYGALAHLQRPTNVAFEIDAVDDAGAGWSVVVQGRARAVVMNTKLSALWDRADIVPWAPLTPNVFVSITPQTVSGRRVQAQLPVPPTAPEGSESDAQETPT